MAAGLARHSARPPPSCGAWLPTLLGAARCCPLQVALPWPPRCSCGRCLPSATCSHCRRPVAYKRRRAAAFGEHHTPTSLHSAEQQGDVALKAHVARACFNYFKCFRGMLQVMDVAKIDRDVAHVAIVVHVCCKRLFQCFICFFRCML